MVKIFVETPSRLHFTLIDLNGELGRVDGGIGVTLEKPGWKIEVLPSKKFVVEGLGKELAKIFAEKFFMYYGLKPDIKIKILDSIPQHVGLGSGTQLALAIATSLTKIFGIKTTIRELAKIMERGGTSGIGVAAFEGGGFILDGGHSFGEKKQKQSFLPSHFSNAPPAPILARYSLPENWMFVVVIPNIQRSIHGLEEFKIFKTYCPISTDEVNKLSRIILMKILPSIVEKNIVDFGKALTEIQNIGFKKIEIQLQKSIVKELIGWMVENGAYGAGMSSFGPVVYGLVDGTHKAEKLKDKINQFLDEKNIGGKVFSTKVNNKGAIVKEF